MSTEGDNMPETTTNEQESSMPNVPDTAEAIDDSPSPAVEEVKETTENGKGPVSPNTTDITNKEELASAASPNSKEDDNELSLYETHPLIKENDVLSGRGSKINQHPGNSFFRALIRQNKLRYVNSKPSDKKKIILEIIDKVEKQDPPGRFLKQDAKTAEWEVISFLDAKRKTGQALREDAPKIREMTSIATGSNRSLGSNLTAMTDYSLPPEYSDEFRLHMARQRSEVLKEQLLMKQMHDEAVLKSMAGGQVSSLAGMSAALGAQRQLQMAMLMNRGLAPIPGAPFLPGRMVNPSLAGLEAGGAASAAAASAPVAPALTGEQINALRNMQLSNLLESQSDAMRKRAMENELYAEQLRKRARSDMEGAGGFKGNPLL